TLQTTIDIAKNTNTYRPKTKLRETRRKITLISTTEPATNRKVLLSKRPDFHKITGSSTINYKIGNERLVKVTEAASRKLASLLEEKGKPNGALRLAVIGGGCSGLQYTMDLVEGPANRDILIQASNVRVVVDPKSA